MDVNARWVMIDGQQLLHITLPDHQHATVAAATGWQLLLYLRHAMRNQPPNTADFDRRQA